MAQHVDQQPRAENPCGDDEFLVDPGEMGAEVHPGWSAGHRMHRV
jgi:hypothetical protein